MLNPYYEQELSQLRKLGAEFARKNPALAPLLGADQASDPDVERLLEGVAFLTGLVRQRLDDDFPEFIQSLGQMLFPHFLRPLPCMTIMQYQPRMQLESAYTVPAGTEFASIPVQGQRVVFSSAVNVDIQPIRLESVAWEPAGAGNTSLRLQLRQTGAKQNSWQSDSLRFFLGGNHADATRLYLLLMRYVQQIRLIGADGSIFNLKPENIVPVGFDPQFNLLPWPANAHPAWRLLHEYFAMPEKFLFIDITGLAAWPGRATQQAFTLDLQFSKLPDWTPEVNNDSFIMHATPAANLFKLDSQPIRVDHKQVDYRIRPLADSSKQAELIYSIETVSGRNAQGQEQSYHEFTAFKDENSACYSLRIRASALDRSYDHYLSLPYVGSAPIQNLTLSARLWCTNGYLPESLRLGEVNVPTENSPARIGFSNILPLTPYSPPRFESDLLWQMLSHLNSNHRSLASPGQLQNLLQLYVPKRQTSAGQQNASLSMIAALQRLHIQPAQRLVRGIPVPGSEITLHCNGDHFTSLGSLYLFGSVLDEFLASTTALNTFSRLTIIDTVNGETLSWPAKIGRFRLL